MMIQEEERGQDFSIQQVSPSGVIAAQGSTTKTTMETSRRRRKERMSCTTTTKIASKTTAAAAASLFFLLLSLSAFCCCCCLPVVSSFTTTTTTTTITTVSTTKADAGSIRRCGDANECSPFSSLVKRQASQDDNDGGRSNNHSANNNNNNNNNNARTTKNKRPKKGGRFAQSLHLKQQQQQQQRSPFVSQNQQQQEPQMTPSVVRPAAAAAVDVVPPASETMWRRRHRSIEDLEEALEKRWGTNDLSAWTAHESELELEEGDDEYDNDKNRASSLSSFDKKQKKEEQTKSSLFRARPVKDPWATHEKDGTAPSSSSSIWGSTSDKTQRNNYYNNNDSGLDPILQRVKRNQQKVAAAKETSTNNQEQQQQQQQKTQQNRIVPRNYVEKATVSNYEDDEEMDDIDDDDDYEEEEDENDEDDYDDDDGEFEGEEEFDDSFSFHSQTSSSSRTTRKDTAAVMDFTHLVASKPAGGKGTHQVQPPLSSSSSSFFFKAPTTTTDNDNTNNAQQQQQQDEEEQRSQRRRTPAVAVPLLDEENGNPLFLTTKQAQRNFKSLLSATAKVAATTTTTNKEESNEYSDGEDDDEDTSTGGQAVIIDPSMKAFDSWQDLGVTDPILLKNLRTMGCSEPLSVQAKAIPPILSSGSESSVEMSDTTATTTAERTKDIVIGTYTGSGKTLAFLVPIAQQLMSLSADESPVSGTGIQAVIVAPGRELASQIVSVARDLLQDTSLRVHLAIGGVTFSRNLENIRKKKPHILVGTPGRLAELLVGKPGTGGGQSGRGSANRMGGGGGGSGGRIKLNPYTFQFLVLDECDALLQYSAHKDPTNALVRYVMKHCSSSRSNFRSILCSATASDLVRKPDLLRQYVRPGFLQALADDNDVLVTSSTAAWGGTSNPTSDDDETSATTTERATTRVSRTVIHGVVHVPHRRLALETLRRILHTEPLPQQILVFVENSRKVNIVVEKLAEMGIIAAPLHGGTDGSCGKTDRAEVSKALREGYVGLVVATELAARGLDAPLLTHVINFDLPTDASHYAHRAGRCGRGGRPGVVINLTTSPQERNVPRKFAYQLGVDLFTVEARNGKLNIVDPATQELDL